MPPKSPHVQGQNMKTGKTLRFLGGPVPEKTEDPSLLGSSSEKDRKSVLFVNLVQTNILRWENWETRFLGV